MRSAARLLAPAGTSDTPPYFPQADWLWTPIPASPTLDANSSTWAGYFATGAHVCNLHQFGTTLVTPSQVDAGTPRYTVALANAVAWGDPLLGTIAVPDGTVAPPMDTGTEVPGDAHLVVADDTSNKVVGLWQAVHEAGPPQSWSATYGGITTLNGDGIDTAGSATATHISRYAAVIRASELTAAAAADGHIPHALFVSSSIAGPAYRTPGQASDGQNHAAVATPIPEGARFQLNPSVDVDAIAGITAAEKVIAKTLQVYGGYVGDQGGAELAFIFEYQTDGDPGAAYEAVGLAWDYFELANIPWDQLRVLANWDGSGDEPPPTGGPTVVETVTPTPLTSTASAFPATTSSAVQTGDILVFAMAENNFNAANLLTPTDSGGVGTWTLAIDGTANASCRMRTWTAPVTAGGAKTVTGHVNAGNPALLEAHLLVVRGGATVGPTSVARVATGTTHAAPTVTTTTDDTLLIGVWMFRNAAGSATVPGSMTQLAATVVGSFYTLVTASELVAAAGATGTRTATFSVSNLSDNGLIAISPAT